jgi:uncharacterized protein YgiM (DUF1202 family)
MKKVLIFFTMFIFFITSFSASGIKGNEYTRINELQLHYKEKKEAESRQNKIAMSDTDKSSAVHKLNIKDIPDKPAKNAVAFNEVESIIKQKNILPLTMKYSDEIPEAIPVDLKYTEYEMYTNYILIVNDGINIREEPTAESEIKGKAKHFEKFKLLAEEKGEYQENYETDIWYRISFNKDNETQEGYILSAFAEKREFQFTKMYESVNILFKEINAKKSAYIVNYKNRTKAAPRYKGRSYDEFGRGSYQAAPAYYDMENKEEFRYINDGRLVSILDETDDYYKIDTLAFEGEYYIPKEYVSLKNRIVNLKNIIVVDRKNQNEAVFELIDNKWTMISYTYATTGEKAKYKTPTELGYFMAIEIKEKLLYVDDITRKLAGYAPHVIRFNGGAYIHGVPLDYIEKDGELIDPGQVEYSKVIGTIPKSHKCVRNYTSHAKFLVDRVNLGECAVIVIE